MELVSSEFEGFWDAKDLMRVLKVSRSWVYQHVESGDLPHLRVGGLLRFEPSAIRRWASGKQG